MHNYKYSLAAISLLLSIAVICFFHISRPSFTTKTISLSFLLKNNSNQRIENSVFSVELPQFIDKYQIITFDNIKLIKNKHDFHIEKINPYSTKKISFTVSVDKSPVASSVFNNDVDYLADNNYLDINNPDILNLAKQLQAKTVYKTSNAIYDWLINNIEPSAYVHRVNGSPYTLKNKQGDCTEFAHLFVSLARASKIPARVVKGLYIPQSSTLLDPMDYHDWAEFYDGDRWIIADAQKQHFDGEYSNYLMIDELTNPDSSEPRFSISDQRINVSFE